MNFTRKELKEKAKLVLKGNRKTFAIITFLLTLIALLPSIFMSNYPNASNVISLLTAGAIELSFISVSFTLLINKEIDISEGFDGFAYFLKSIAVNLMRTLFIMLWLLLLVIPGLIKAYSYALTFFIIADNPEIGVLEAITLSKKMMNGYKMDLFVLHLSFIGWVLLIPLTLGLGLLWLRPYMEVTKAEFYFRVKANYNEIYAI